MSAWPLVEGLLLTLIVGWSLRTAWRVLVPAVQAALSPAPRGKACGSGCQACDSGADRSTRPQTLPRRRAARASRGRVSP
jgi:hypothetical protein